MFTIEMLPAEYGDCLWLEWGSPAQPRRMLIDGGTAGTYRLLKERIEKLAPEERRIDLFVITHIDSDHIDGAVKLVSNPPEGLDIGEYWFNAYKHCAPGGYLGIRQGEYLAAELEELQRRRDAMLWNTRFAGHAVAVRDQGPLPSFELEGGLRLTLLGPNSAALQRLKDEWERGMRELSWQPGDTEAALEAVAADRRYRPGWLGCIDLESWAAAPFEEDDSPTNGSSIVFIAEYEGRCCLFAADAQPGPLAKSLERYDARGSHIDLAVCKVPHHGSQYNNSTELYGKLRAEHFLVSSSGRRFGHPDKEAIARLLVNKPPRQQVALHFNYLSRLNAVWADADLQQEWRYRTCYPDDPAPECRGGLLVL